MNEPGRFRKKPVKIQAIQWTGDNVDAVFEFTAGAPPNRRPQHLVNSRAFSIPTLEGTMRAAPGDWIIRGVAGEFYPCKPDIFAETYEPLV